MTCRNCHCECHCNKECPTCRNDICQNCNCERCKPYEIESDAKEWKWADSGVELGF